MGAELRWQLQMIMNLVEDLLRVLIVLGGARGQGGRKITGYLLATYGF